METDLEKYLIKHRPSLDVESPDDPLIWEGIRKDLQHPASREGRRRSVIRIRNIAAVAVIVVSIGYMILDIIGDRRSAEEISLSSIDRELGAREKEYRALVGIKCQEAGTFGYPDNSVIAELLEEIEALDTIYKETMKDLGELGYNEQAIQTIFDTYEKKIYLLELIILENNKIKNHEADANLFL
jgi:hypothetical protein